MTQLTVIAKIKAKPGSERTLHQELVQLIPPTLLEKGCLTYDLHQSIEDTTLFLFYENWENRAHWEKHTESAHITAFRTRTNGLIEQWELLLMRPEKSRIAEGH